MLNKTKQALPIIFFSLLIVVTLLLIHLVFKVEPEPSVAVDKLNNLQLKTIEIIIEMDKFLLSISLLIIAGIGGLLIQKYQAIKIKSLFQKVIILISFLFAISSIYFGYVLYFKMVEMLSNNMFDAKNALIEQPQRFQYYSLLFAVIFFCIFVLSETVTNNIRSKSDDNS